MFPLLKDTTNAITRHPGLVFAFVGGAVAITAPVQFADDWIGTAYAGADLPGWYGAYKSLKDLWLIAAYSLLQTVIYCRLGADMDKPLWRCSGTRDALHRFLPIWVLVNLITTALIRAEESMAVWGVGDAVALVDVLVLLAMVLLPMFATCLMFMGGLIWSRVEEALSPIARNPVLSLQVMLLGLTSFLMQNIVVMEEGLAWMRTPVGLTLLSIPIALLDIITFAAMWRVCMYQRDHGHRVGDPYDF